MAHVHRDGVLLQVRSRLPEFRGALRRVAVQVLGDPAGTVRLTIADLAERAGTSPATVTRFCRRLGFDGYAHLRLGLASETGAMRRPDGVAAHGVERVFRRLIMANHLATFDTAVQLDLGELERAAQAIAGARRVNVFGSGPGALAAAELQFFLHRLGLTAWSWSDVHNALAGAALLGPGDVMLAVAHDGGSREAIDTLAEAGGHGATTVALTGSRHAPLAGVADVVLLAAGPRSPQLLVLDLLALAVAQRMARRRGTTPATRRRKA